MVHEKRSCVKSLLQKNYLFIIFVGCTIIYAIFWVINSDLDIINGDGLYYYRYFVKIFINNDILGSGLIKFPVGTTLLQLPFLLLGVLISFLFGIHVGDGLENVFQVSVYIAAWFYCLLGLTIIYNYLKKMFSPAAATLTCFCVLYGTMMLHYTTRGASYSHIYGFFACTLFMVYVDWYESNYEKKNKMILDFLFGVLLGEIALIRNTNVIILFVYVLYNVTSVKKLTKRLRSVFSVKLMTQILGFVVIYAIQIICWWFQTGKFVFYSYGEEKFTYYKNPQVLKVLFSDAKGLFIYSPILILAVIGILFARSNEKFRLSQCLIFIVQTYIVSAWWCWWLGVGYGQRMYCDIICIFVVPLASLFYEANEVLTVKEENTIIPYRKIYVIFFYIIVLLFVQLNFIWMQGVHNGKISGNFGTWYTLKNYLIEYMFK